MKRLDLILIAGSLLLGAASAWSTDRALRGMDEAKAEVRQAKEELIRSADLFDLHNRIYSRVGPEAWERRVKPEFMSRITVATVRDTGSYFPEAGEVVSWVRAHPEEARRMLEGAAVMNDPFLR